LAIVTNKDLATHCREQFSRPLTYSLWFMAEVAIIGSDIQEVIGTAIALRILFGLPLWLGAVITI
jgi:NRAMP (natural resistance-associated macrophage protein)-like metal ion transporter